VKGKKKMSQSKVQVYVYGAEQVCASCVNLPSSKETAEWLKVVLHRKFGDQVELVYVDIFSPENERDVQFSQRILEEDLWYPVVVIEGEIVDEGSPKAKKIVNKLIELGLRPIV
jgi:disulfide oxidoreductase YuzD